MPGTRVMCPGFYMMCYYVAITMVDKVGGPVSKENAKKESCGSSRWPRSFVSHGMQDSSLAGRVTGVPGYPPGNRVLASVPSHRRAQPASCVLATGEVVSQQVAPSGMWPKTRGVCACAILLSPSSSCRRCTWWRSRRAGARDRVALARNGGGGQAHTRRRASQPEYPDLVQRSVNSDPSRSCSISTHRKCMSSYGFDVCQHPQARRGCWHDSDSYIFLWVNSNRLPVDSSFTLRRDL